MQLQIEENVTTGYHWQVDEAKLHSITLRSDSHQQTNHRLLVGAPQRRIWTLCVDSDALHGSKTEFNAIYVRPWEQDKPVD